MKTFKYIFIIFILSSCVEDPLGDSTYTTITNKSGHSIELQEYIGGAYRTSTFIDNNKSKEFNLTSGDPGDPTGPFIRPLTSADSIRVIYFEKASIWHTKDENSPVSRSLMLESSYEGGKTGDKKYEFTYTFTPEDYEEALKFGE